MNGLSVVVCGEDEMTPLSQWLRTPPIGIVAVKKGQQYTAEDLVVRVSYWIAVLREQPGKRWAVYHNDPFEFAAIVFALWQLSRTACVPGDACEKTVQRMQVRVDGFAGEFPGRNHIQNSFVQSVPHDDWHAIDPKHVALEIYTSGSTGEPKAITKTINQLEAELNVIESLWPSDQAVETVVLSTVSHQHFYGMIFRLFWPLCAHRPFERELCEYSEEIQQLALGYSSFDLISSPSHLGRMNLSVDWGAVSGRCRFLLSSAAPLAKEDSVSVSQLLSVQVNEVYGSSETGVIAWRTQSNSSNDGLWHPLPENILSSTVEGTLCVRSPYVGDELSLHLPDQVEFVEGGRFQLKGRLDRIVKVEGKRVSLNAIEQQLSDDSLVKMAKILLVKRRRIETAAAVQLTIEGAQLLKSKGRKALIKKLKNTLALSFETVVLPRRWRFVDRMPFNRQGKLPLDVLEKMFEKEPIRFPEVKDESVTGNEVTIKCRIPSELVYFNGHFDSNPILPGIAQVHWAESFGRNRLAVTGRFLRLEVVKFQQVIVPESDVTILLAYDAEKNKLSFKYESDKGVHSSGRICFE